MDPMNHQPEKSWPTWTQVLVLIFGGIGLAASFCAGFAQFVGFVGGSKGGQLLAYILAGGFFLSVLVFLLGLVALLTRIIRSIFRK
jgi:hypothetical protein